MDPGLTHSILLKSEKNIANCCQNFLEIKNKQIRFIHAKCIHGIWGAKFGSNTSISKESNSMGVDELEHRDGLAVSGARSPPRSASGLPRVTEFASADKLRKATVMLL
jgi:hypothetical protein